MLFLAGNNDKKPAAPEPSQIAIVGKQEKKEPLHGKAAPVPASPKRPRRLKRVGF